MGASVVHLMYAILDSPLFAEKVLTGVVLGLTVIWGVLATAGVWKWTPESLGRLVGTSLLLVSVFASVLAWPAALTGQLILVAAVVFGLALVVSPRKTLPVAASIAATAVAAVLVGMHW